MKNSKRSIKKVLEKQLRKLLPSMAFFVRSRGECWYVVIGKKHWSKSRCYKEGHMIWSVKPDLVYWVTQDLERYRSIPEEIFTGSVAELVNALD